MSFTDEQFHNLNRLADNYILYLDQNVFNTLYKEYRNGYDFADIAKREVRDGDVANVEGEFDDTFLQLINTHIVGENFAGKLSTALSNDKKDFYKKQKTCKKHFQSFSDGDALTGVLEKSKDPKNLDEQILETFGESLKDRRKALVQFFKDVNEDPVTAEILELIPKYKSLNQVAIKLNIHPMTLDRKLKKLRSKYQEDLFGCHRQYL